MNDWMTGRLTPYKQNEPRWADLARAIEQFWDTHNTPALERLEQLRSVFTAHDEDIEMLLSESGVKFEVAVPIEKSNRAFSYAWRAYEIHRKDRHHTLESILSRDFSGMFVRWMPLFAPKSLPYGQLFLIENDIEKFGYTRADMHRTYRGRTTVSLTDLHVNNVTKAEFAAASRRRMEALRPAHIVYDGEYFFQIFKAFVPEFIITNAAKRKRSTQNLNAGFIPVHSKGYGGQTGVNEFVSIETLARNHLRKQRFEFWKFTRSWSLDLGSVIDGDYWSLQGAEGGELSRVGTLGKKRVRQYSLAKTLQKDTFSPDFSILSNHKAGHEKALKVGNSTAAFDAEKVTFSVPVRLAKPSADIGPRLDDIPADFAPLDMEYEVTNG